MGRKSKGEIGCSADFAEMGCSAEHHVWVRFVVALFGIRLKPRWPRRNEDFQFGSCFWGSRGLVKNNFFWPIRRDFENYFVWSCVRILPSLMNTRGAPLCARAVEQ